MVHSPEPSDRPFAPAGQPGAQPTGHDGYGVAGAGEQRESSVYAPGYAQFAGAGPSLQTGRNVPGIVALTAAILLFLLALLRQFIAMTLPLLLDSGRSFDEVNSLYIIPGSILALVLGLIATIAGGVGLARRSAPRTAAAIGLAIGVWVLTLEVVSLVAPTLI